MNITDYFKSPQTMSADDVREFLKEKSPEDFNLIDVRQPGEYEQGHLPGSRLIPVAELDATLAALDHDKPTIAY